MTDLRSFFTTANDLVDVTRRCDQARRRVCSDAATFREFLAYEALAEKQQLLASKVIALHRVANGKAFE